MRYESYALERSTPTTLLALERRTSAELSLCSSPGATVALPMISSPPGCVQLRPMPAFAECITGRTATCQLVRDHLLDRHHRDLDYDPSLASSRCPCAWSHYFCE